MGGGAPANETIRVDVGIIDRLMDLAGELVLTRNQIMQIQERGDDSVFAAPPSASTSSPPSCKRGSCACV